MEHNTEIQMYILHYEKFNAQTIHPFVICEKFILYFNVKPVQQLIRLIIIIFIIFFGCC